MNYDDLSIFHHVAKHGTFTAAARALRRPKSSVSAAVSRLEAHLGLRLFERTTRRVRLTRGGAALQERSAEHLEALQEIMLSSQSQNRTVSGTLKLAAPYEFGAHHLASISAALMSKFEDLQIFLDVEHHTIDLIENDYDIVFSMTDRTLEDSSIVAKRVFILERGLFAAPSLVEEYKMPTHPEDLKDMPLLCGIDDVFWKFVSPPPKRNALGVNIVNPRMISPNAGVRKQAALLGVGIARVTTTYCAAELETGELVQLLPDYECQPLKVYALMPTRRITLPKVRIFLNALANNERAKRRR
jgi:DNA-binding transcriptional LysR family regulator